MTDSSSDEAQEVVNIEEGAAEGTVECADDDSNGRGSVIPNREEGDNHDAVDQSGGTEEQVQSSPRLPQLKEIKHLKRRIRNVEESIQLSRDAIASDLKKYQDNVLNATQGCVNEWRAIARFYKITSEEEDDSEGISPALRTEVGLVVFGLMQLSVQCGPLSGSNAGYFKRCGAEVAKVVLEFLEENVPKHDELGIERMGFSSKQMDAMKKWIVNAEKAVENDKPPSRTAIKKMKQLQAKVDKQNLQKHNKIKKKKKKGRI